MKKVTKKLIQYTGAILLVAFVFAGCKKQVDEPPYPTEPDLVVNTTIAQLQAKFTGTALTIAEDLVLKAYVVGDDESGNIYKKLIVQDATGGIDIEVDGNNLFNTYPVGSWVYIKAKGLSLGMYNGLLELGLGLNATNQPVRIPSNVLSNYLVKSYSTDVIQPVELTIAQLEPKYQNMLVKIKDAQFDDAELGKTYADPNYTTISTQNRIVKDCANGSLTLRISDVAKFAGEPVAKGKGDLVGIYTVFGATKQFLVRNLNDFAGMTGLRCDGSNGGGGNTGDLALITIADLKAKLDINSPNNTEVILPAATKIKGVVISASVNEAAGNFRVQEPNGAGIMVRVSGTATLALGTQVEINVSSQKLAIYNGDLQLTVPSNYITSAGTGTITPANITLPQIISGIKSITSTLVKLTGEFSVSATPSGTTGVNYTLTSPDGSIVTFVRTAVGYTLPTGVSSITGYLSLYNGANQITIRSAADVVAGAGNPGGGNPGGTVATSLTEDFATLTEGGNTASTGAGAPSGTLWTGNSNFPTVDRAYPAGGMVKLGVTASVGSITSKTLDLSANGGKVSVKFDAKGWTSAGTVTVTVNGVTQTANYTAVMADATLSAISLTFPAGTGNATSTVTIATPTTSYRCYIDNVRIETTP